jgi:hypothetical protein
MPNVETSTSGRPPSAQPELDMDDVPVDELWSPFVPSVEPPPPVEPVSVDPPAPFVAAGTSPSRPGSATPPPGGVQSEAMAGAGSVRRGIEPASGSLGAPVLPVVPVPTDPDVATPTPTVGGGAAHVHIVGQSALVAHTILFGWQRPGSGVVVQLSGGVVVPPSTATAGMFGPLDASEPFEPAAGVGTPPPPEPEQDVAVSGMQVKPVPQSASTLHANDHLYAHSEIVFGVQSGVGTGSHSVPTAHAAPALAHSSVDEWQTISAPQSASVVHVAGSHELTVETPASTIGSGATTGHAAFFGHGGCAGSGVAMGIVVVTVVTHMKPFPQSVAPQVAAWARAPASAPTRHPTVRISFGRDENDMSAPFVR